MKRTVSALILTGAIVLSSTFTFAQSTKNAAEIYTDISGHWSKAAIQVLFEKNALPFEENRFFPAKAITKGEFVSVLHDALGIQIEYLVAPDIKDYFNDVSPDAKYAEDLIDLVTASIIEKGGSFNPDATITREQMVHYVMEAYKYEMGDRYALINIKPPFFRDDSDVTPGFGGDVGRAAHYKIISGSKGMFLPKANATRGEAAVVISKLVALLEKQNPAVSVLPEANISENSIEMKVTLKNVSDKVIDYGHSSGQMYDFVLYDSDKKELYRWSDGKFFTMALVYSKIKPGESVVYTETLSGEQFKSIKDKIASMKAFVIGNSDDFKIQPEGYEVILK